MVCLSFDYIGEILSYDLGYDWEYFLSVSKNFLNFLRFSVFKMFHCRTGNGDALRQISPCFIILEIWEPRENMLGWIWPLDGTLNLMSTPVESSWIYFQTLCGYESYVQMEVSNILELSFLMSKKTRPRIYFALQYIVSFQNSSKLPPI